MRKSKAMSSKTSTLDSVASFKRAPRDIQDLEFLEKLGDGLFGVVWRARNVYSGEVVAVKKFNSSNVAAKLEFLKEAKIIKTLRHENLLRFLAMFVVQDERLACGSGLYLVTEFCEGGDLAKRLADDSHPLSWRDRVHFALDIARGLAHLHKNNVIHRDLKCENCLIYPTPTSKSLTSSPATPAAATSHERTSMPKQGSQMGAAPHSAPGSPPLPRHAVRPRVVLADFGLARWHASLDGSDKPSKMTVCGTPYTMAPELMDVHVGARYSSSCDVFSFGVVLCEIATRSRAVDLPRSDDMGVDVRGVARMIAPAEFGDQSATRDHVFLKNAILALVRKCCVVTPAKRPPVSAVVVELDSMLEAITQQRSDAAGMGAPRVSHNNGDGLDVGIAALEIGSSSTEAAPMRAQAVQSAAAATGHNSLSTVAERPTSSSSSSSHHHKSKSKSSSSSDSNHKAKSKLRSSSSSTSKRHSRDR